METIKLMNPTLWIFAIILIIWVLVQSSLFLRLALNFNKKNNLLSRDQLQDCVKVGSTSVVGPATNAMAICLAMVGMVGSADTFMRCGVIGAPMQELYLAQWASVTAGVSFGTAEFTPAVMTFCIWLQVWGSIPFFIHTIISLKPLDMAVEKSKASSGAEGPQFMKYMGDAAMFGIMSYFICSYVIARDKCAAIVASIIGAVVVGAIQKKTGNKTLASLSMVICMVIGMIAGEIAFGTMA